MVRTHALLVVSFIVAFGFIGAGVLNGVLAQDQATVTPLWKGWVVEGDRAEGQTLPDALPVGVIEWARGDDPSEATHAYIAVPHEHNDDCPGTDATCWEVRDWWPIHREGWNRADAGEDASRFSMWFHDLPMEYEPFTHAETVVEPDDMEWATDPETDFGDDADYDEVTAKSGGTGARADARAKKILAWERRAQAPLDSAWCLECERIIAEAARPSGTAAQWEDAARDAWDPTWDESSRPVWDAAWAAAWETAQDEGMPVENSANLPVPLTTPTVGVFAPAGLPEWRNIREGLWEATGAWDDVWVTNDHSYLRSGGKTLVLPRSVPASDALSAWLKEEW